MKPKYNTSKLRSQAFGASLVTAITFCIAGSATAADIQWSPTATTSDWNTAANWTGGVKPIGVDNAVINVITGNPVVTTATTPTVNQTWIGDGTGNSGKLELQTGGVMNAGNWTAIGRGAGTGTLNITGGTFNNGGNGVFIVSSGAGSTGTLTMSGGTINTNRGFWFGEVGGLTGGGTATIANATITTNAGGGNNLENRFIIGQRGIGVLTLNAGSVINSLNGSEFFVGNGPNGNGTLTQNAGSITTNNWTVVGRNDGGAATGVYNMNGGSFTKTGGGQFIVGDNGNGTVNQTGGTITCNNEYWVGQGSLTSTQTMSLGTLNVNNWIAVGRQGGTGIFNLNGGTVNKTSLNGDVTVGAGTNGAADGVGTFNMTGGILNCATDLQICEDGSRATSAFNISGGSATFRQIQPGSTNSIGTGILNADGGTITVGSIVGNGTATKVANFNGSQIIASGNSSGFIAGLNTAEVKPGGLKVNSQAFNIFATALLSGTGGVTKTGSGVFTLTGNNTFSGASSVLAGKLNITAPCLTGDLTVAASTTLGVIQSSSSDTAKIGNVNISGSGPSNPVLEFNLNALTTAPGLAGAPALEFNNMNVTGLVTSKVIIATPALGYYPLYKRNNAISGSGNIDLTPVLPPGVTGVLTDSPPSGVAGVTYLEITSISALTWKGSVNNSWINGGPTNWVNGALAVSAYSNVGNPAVFFNDDDSVVRANNNIDLADNITPSSISFGSGINTGAPFPDYVISSTTSKAIGGSGGIKKDGVYNVNISTLNTYTGTNSYLGGTLTAATIGNAGSASAIGQNASLGTFSGGTLAYTGPTTTTNRTLDISNSALLNSVSSGLNTTNDLTITGLVSASNGRMTKGGAGNLTLTNSGNTLSRGSYTVSAGTLTLDDGAGTNINTSFGDTVVAGGATFNVNNTNFSNLGASGGGNPAIFGVTIVGEATAGLASMAITNGSVYTTSSQFVLAVNAPVSPPSPGLPVQANLLLDNSTLNVGAYFSVGAVGNATMTMSGNSVLTAVAALNVADTVGSTGIMTVGGNASITAGELDVGKAANTVGTLNFNSGTLTTNESHVGRDTPNSSGVVNQAGGSITTGTGGNDSYIGDRGVGIWNISGASSSLTVGADFRIGHFATATGTLNVTGGTVTQPATAPRLVVGDAGTGVINISGTGLISTAAPAGVVLTNSSTGNATVNLNAGGTLETLTAVEGAGGGTSTLNFDGGKLKAAAGSTVLLGAIDSVLIKAGGANIEVQGADITAVTGSIGEVGSNRNLTKSGTGTLLLNSLCGYSGVTTVSAGTLGGTGGLFSDVVVNAGATLKPGVAPGDTLTAQNITLNGAATFSATLNATTSTIANAASALNLGGSALVVTGTPTSGTTYVIANYTTRTGTFSSIPAGYTVNYNDLASTAVTITYTTPSASPYDTWIALFPTITAPADKLPTADPDGDGVLNSVEFALDGNPASGSQGAKVYNILADTADVGTAKEEIITIAVRVPSGGSIAFAGAPSPSGIADLYTYTIQGSTTLTAFGSTVTEVIPFIPPVGPVPALSVNYEYRSFTLGSSDGLPNKGFMRVKIEN